MLAPVSFPVATFASTTQIPDKLYFFSRSADKSPGQGANEYIQTPFKYAVLKATPDWRKMLSNFWLAPFEVSGVRWNTIEAMFQGYKINLARPDIAWQFSLNSGSALSQASGDEAQKNRKIVILTPDQLSQWEAMKENVLYHGLKAKFSQNPALLRILKATGTAELWHGTPRVAAQRQYTLERVRDEL